MKYMHNEKIRLAHEFADKAEAEWMQSEQGKQAHAEGWWPRACRYINDVNFAIGMLYHEEPEYPVMCVPSPIYLHDGDDSGEDRRYGFMQFAREYGKMGKPSRKIPERLTSYWKQSCKFKPYKKLKVQDELEGGIAFNGVLKANEEG